MQSFPCDNTFSLYWCSNVQESGGSGRKSEIRMDDSGVPLAVIEKRRADALKAKENKDRIKEYVAKRPSLIERHNQVVYCF